MSDSIELPSAVVRSPRLSYTGSRASVGDVGGPLLQLGARGRRGIVTYPWRGSTGAIDVDDDDDGPRLYGVTLRLCGRVLKAAGWYWPDGGEP